jgi:hypothetical protein
VKKPIPKKPTKKVSPKPGRIKPCAKKERGQKSTIRHDLKEISPKDQKDAESIAAGKRVMCETRRQFEKAGFTEQKIAEELALMAFSDPADHAEIAEGGELRFKTFEEQGSKRRAIKSIKEKTVITESKDGEKVFKTSTVEWTMQDKLQALGMAVDVIGIKKPVKHDHNISGNLADLMRQHLAGKK